MTNLKTMTSVDLLLNFQILSVRSIDLFPDVREQRHKFEAEILCRLDDYERLKTRVATFLSAATLAEEEWDDAYGCLRAALATLRDVKEPPHD